ncbi:MAG: aldehyde dehydrogenase family protein [Polyangiaceae bacterium]|nr:aldehyde dehydrogenase family protein [Polyangiaceae bacterium]
MIPREAGARNLLARLTAEQRASLDARMEHAFYPAGEALFEEGDRGERFYLVDEGLVRLELPQVDFEGDRVLTYVEAGELLGELSMLDERPRSVSAYAHRDTRCRVLSRPALEALCAAEPALGLAVISALGRQAAMRLRDANIRQMGDGPISRPETIVEAQVRRAAEAQAALVRRRPSEAEIDDVLRAVAGRLLAEARSLAEEAVQETGLGDVEDKAHKNRLACEGVLETLLGRPAAGEIGRQGDVVEIASPVGVVFAIVPITNPTSNAIFKVLVCLKTRNAVILSFHRAATRVGIRTVAIAREALRARGLPPDLVQVVEGRTSRRQTQQYMKHPAVGLILATGGPDMVRAAYSSGTPALGVGPGNAPVWVCADADPERVARDVVRSKTYDHGIICGSEHNLVVDRAAVGPLWEALERRGAAVLDVDEGARALPALLGPEGTGIRRALLGKPAAVIAQAAGVRRPYPIELLVVPAPLGRLGSWLSREKLAPVLSLFPVQDEEQAIEACLRILDEQGAGHTAVIHTQDEARIRRFAEVIPAGRLLVNTPATLGMLGITTDLPLSFMLGCGTFGGNTTTDAINFRHLLNIKRLACGRAEGADAAPASAPDSGDRAPLRPPAA